MQRPSTTFLLLCLVTIAGCKDPPKSDGTGAAAAASSAPPAASVSATVATPAPAVSGGLMPDASGVLSLSWKATNAPDERVNVSVVAGDVTIALGPLAAASDDAAGTVATCAMHGNAPTFSKFECGGTPHYNFYTASLTGNALVISLVDGVYDEKKTETVKEVARRPTSATSLRVTGPASPGLYGNCRVGSVQKTADGQCMRQCLKGTECKNGDTCTFVTVKGSDGDHKVHACVPPGK